MRTILTIILAVMTYISASAYKYSYSFNNTPISEAIVKINKEHTDINISFIYKELDNYKTSARIHTDDAYEALRQTIALNPISIIKKDRNYYIEALQHGKFCYTGRAIGNDNEPVVAATVMLLAPKDSTVITYGITDDAGHFSIPCDRQGVIAKLTCLGYKPTYKMCESFSVGIVRMNELPIRLQAVEVEADNAYLLSDRSIYRPTQRQKNSSQTATDLLVRMAIPQLNTRLGSSSVTTASGQPVAIYIDYVPASENDLKMMRMTDVKSVEYLEYPSDTRFQGNRYVINFRMTQYEYGGYVKVLGTENLIANSGFLQANARLVKKRMTYDIMGYGYYMANNHFGEDQVETFRLPHENGDMKIFQRESLTESSKYRRNNYQTSFRALYSGDKITANSQIAVGIDETPYNDNTGVVKYTDNILAPSSYSSNADSKAKYLSYNGFYYFGLANNNSLTASLNYSYSHTNQNSLYSETDMDMIYNGAKDNTHKGNISLNYSQSFCDKHSFMALIRGLYEHNRTNYSGSVTDIDNSSTKFGQIGASYSFTDKKISASLGFGWNWLATRLDNNKAISNYPYIDASLNFVPNKKNAFGAVLHYSVWPPSSNYKSENIIQVSPFLWHTGNPLLKSHRSYDIGINYTFIPSNRFNMTVFANSWLVGNRAAFVYDATSEGIIRTIQQPIGKFSHYNYGINASSNFLDGKLHLYGQIAQIYVHNGLPYNINHSYISYYVQALYYLSNFNFAISYNSENATDNYNSMSGIWTKNKDTFVLQAGWSNSTWNIRLTAQNLQRWNWRSSYDTMRSDHYSVNRWVSNASSHAFVQLSVAYTFGFGKQVKQVNDISRQAGASSGILK
ncbi:MAG: TonB-dependent receptor family protein [Muribaculaceae bacterium]|nr:TonB-dependent receptor family protein [Muribaculaceae bacterium]